MDCGFRVHSTKGNKWSTQNPYLCRRSFPPAGIGSGITFGLLLQTTVVPFSTLGGASANSRCLISPHLRTFPRFFWFCLGSKQPFRGPAAEIPTAASQEDLAAKATRGQPMYRPRPPAEWEAADGEAEAVSLAANHVLRQTIFGPCGVGTIAGWHDG